MVAPCERRERHGGSPPRARPRRTGFRSKLPDPVGRFASELVEDGLARGIRTPREFLTAFPASRIARALEYAPQVRASILEIGLGMPRHRAELEPPTVFSITLQRALQTGELDAEALAQLIRPDDRVRYLPRGALWNYVKAERLWWERASTGTVGARARENIRLIVELGILHGLLAPEDVSARGVAEKLVQTLPRRRVAALLRAALQHAVPSPGTDRRGDSPLASLLERLPVDLVWRVILEPRLESIFLAASLEPRTPDPPEALPAGAPVAAMDCDAFVEYGEQRQPRRHGQRKPADAPPEPGVPQPVY